LQTYAGTLLLVSHDRTFLDNVVTQTLVADPGGTGTWKEYVGGYSEWVAQRTRTVAAPGAAVIAPPGRAAGKAAGTPPARSEMHGVTTARAKLTFAERRELESLPDELETLEREQHALTERMCAAEYHKGSVEEIKADRRRAEEIERALARKFERWGELDAQKTGSVPE